MIHRMLVPECGNSLRVSTKYMKCNANLKRKWNPQVCPQLRTFTALNTVQPLNKAASEQNRSSDKEGQVASHLI